MAGISAIEWTEKTWNPVTGCDKISQGCKLCYAERMAKRLHAMHHPRYEQGFRVTLHEDLLDAPLSWRKPSMIFVNSMSDLFHESVPFEFIESVFRTMERSHHHTFQILTKRAQRLEELAPDLPWASNIWMGVSVEQARWYERIHSLQNVPASIRFLSCEPLLESLPQLPLAGIGWVIVGGESGPHSRPMKKEWVAEIRDQCQIQKVPFFFKQWGGVQKWRNGRSLDGLEYNEMPIQRLA